jgi:hypothetical protein
MTFQLHKTTGGEHEVLTFFRFREMHSSRDPVTAAFDNAAAHVRGLAVPIGPQILALSLLGDGVGPGASVAVEEAKVNVPGPRLALPVSRVPRADRGASGC